MGVNWLQGDMVGNIDRGGLDVPNVQQREAVEHGSPIGTGEPLLIIAGAGTGKTNNLGPRAAHLAVAGVDPSHRLVSLPRRREVPPAGSRRISRYVERRLVANVARCRAPDWLEYLGQANPASWTSCRR